MHTILILLRGRGKVAFRALTVLTLAAFVANPMVLAKDSKGSVKQTAAKKTKKIDAETVKAVRQALVAAGYKVKVDGKMGRQMRSALKKYQRKNRLRVTGRIDQKTIKKMGITPAPEA